MKQRTTEPGLNRIFKNYCGFALLYFSAFFAYTIVTIGEIFSPTLILFYVNLAVYAVLFAYLSWVWLAKKIGRFYFPIAILMATLIPMYSITFFWPFQTGDAISEIIYRSWYLFPILVVPITLVAWQYGYKITLVFIIFTAFFDFPFIIMRINEINSATIQLLGVPLQRSMAFGMVGVIVGLLMNTQKAQQRKLIQANIMLSKHAETLEELATSKERNRLARELHDTLAHTLSSQILTLEALRLSPPADKTEMQTVLMNLIDNSRKGLSETRRALKDLRSKQLDDLGLKNSLDFLLTDASSRTEIKIESKVDDYFPTISKEIEQCIYRIAQEGIENIIRHANATKAVMTLSYMKNELLFEISDNGDGFSLGRINKGESHGIKGMQERVEEVGGILDINSRKKRGTRIIAKFEVADDSRIVM
jgi:signal transduction histidine kinase